MKTTFATAAIFAACTLATPALAAPGLGTEVYGATVDKGEFEAESNWHTLAGGPDNGEDVIKLEAAYGVTDNLRLGVVGEWEKEPGQSRKAEAIGIEAIYELGKVGGINFAAYGEYEIALHGTDKVEAKLLMQHKTGPWDLRFNLIAEKPLQNGAPVELEYAASANVKALGELSLGVEAHGELGTFKHLLPNTEHFLGPVASIEIEGLGPEIEISTGYLFALGKAKADTDGQFRLSLEMEF